MHRCNHCEQEITPSPVAPIVVGIRGPKNVGRILEIHELFGLRDSRANALEVSFCCWECAAMWFNKRAGEILMPDLDHPSGFFGSWG
jgi:hypothetical protein